MSENFPNSVLSFTYRELIITISTGMIAKATYLTGIPYAHTQKIRINRIIPDRIASNLENLYLLFIVMVKNSCIIPAIMQSIRAAKHSLSTKSPANITRMKTTPDIDLLTVLFICQGFSTRGAFSNPLRPIHIEIILQFLQDQRPEQSHCHRMRSLRLNFRKNPMMHCRRT